MLSPHWLEPYRQRIPMHGHSDGCFPGHQTLNRRAFLLALKERNPLAHQLMNKFPIHPLSSIFPPASPEELAELVESVKEFGLRDKIVLLDGQVLDGRNRQDACFEAKVPPIYRDYDPAVDGESIVKFVRDKNLARRQLNTSQRAVVAVGLEPYFAAEIAKRKAEAAKVREENKKKKADDKAKADAAANPPAAESTATPGTVEAAVDPAVVEELETVIVDGTGKGETAAGMAADATGVSTRQVEKAKNLAKTAPEELEKVRTGEKSLDRASKDAKGTKDANRAAGEDVSPYRAEAADLLEANHGEEFSKAVRASTILKTTNELKAFIALPITDQKSVLPYVSAHWKVEQALKFHRGDFDETNTIAHLIAHATAKGGGVAIEVNGFTISIESNAPAASASPAPEKPAADPAPAPEKPADDDDIPIGTKKQPDTADESGRDESGNANA